MGGGGHCPEEGVSQQTVLCTFPGLGTWTVSGQEGLVGQSSHPSMPGHHVGGVSEVLPCPPPASALPPTQGDAIDVWEEQGSRWVGSGLEGAIKCS